MRKAKGALLYPITVGLPAANPRVKAYEPYIEKLDFYRNFLTLLNAVERFDEIAGEIYSALVSGLRVKERDYRRILDALEWEIEKEITAIIMELREAGEEERANFLDQYLAERDFPLLYRTLLAMQKEKWKRIRLYGEIMKFFGDEDFFMKYGGVIFAKLKSRTLVGEMEFNKVERLMSAKILKRMQERIQELRNAGYGREADKIDEYLKRGDIEGAYHILMGIREIKKVEVEEGDAKQFMKIYLDAHNILTLLSRASVDVDDVKWKLGEIMNINSIQIPEERVILVDDPTGNAACFLSIYLKRIGSKYTFFSTSGIGDYWITNIEAENRVNPTLQASNLGELILQTKGIVLLEDINYLILSNKFSEVYRFLYYLKNNIEDKLIFTVNLSVLSEREQTRLRGIADKIVSIEFPVSICSSALVAVENRPKEGALLLSKERAEDFKGKVYIISDFGGENSLHPQRIDFEIVDKIAENIDQGNVIIDALDMLIDENGIEKIYVWLKFVRDIARKRGKRVYVVTRDLVANERSYIRPLMDFDMFLVASMDKKTLGFLQKEIKTIRRILEKRVEKECVYTLEMIKHRFQQYQKYLADLEDKIKEISNISSYDAECILKIAPIKSEIEKRVEEIENMTAEFREIEENINAQIPVLKVFVDVGEIEGCVAKANELINSGDYIGAVDHIKECQEMVKKLQRRALSRAWDIRKELLCVDYLLPPYHREKVMDFEGEKEKLKDFTLLYLALRNLLSRKIENEYRKLRDYAEISSLDIFELGSIIEETHYCEYRKKRDEFLEKFRKVEDELREKLIKGIEVAVKILKERGYDIGNLGENIDELSEIDALIDVWKRVSHHITRYVENYIAQTRERCPRCITTEVGEYLERFRKNTLEEVHTLRDFLADLERQAEKEESMLREINRELDGYYKILDEYGVNYERKYPGRVEEGKDILNYARGMVESLTPEVEMDIIEWKVDETRTAELSFEIRNMGKYPARNITIEVHGALSQKVKIDKLPGESIEVVNITSEVRNPESEVNVDIVYEGPGGKIATKSFVFSPNLKGYTKLKAEGTEKCALCRGKIFKDTDMVICSECGATYHFQCAKRIGKCRICGNPFIF